MNQLLFRCNLKEIIVPDGGLCCEWVMTLILLHESEESQCGTYIKKLRNFQRVTLYKFSSDSNEIIKDLRLSYADSLSYVTTYQIFRNCSTFKQNIFLILIYIAQTCCWIFIRSQNLRIMSLPLIYSNIVSGSVWLWPLPKLVNLDECIERKIFCTGFNVCLIFGYLSLMFKLTMATA